VAPPRAPGVDLDRLDIAIVRELAQEGRVYLPRGHGPSLRAISRKLALSEGAVRSRIASLRASGFLGRPRVIANPRLLGLEQTAYLGSVVPGLSKEVVLRQVCAVEGIFLIVNFHGRELGVIFNHDEGSSPRDKQLLLDRLCGTTADFVAPVHLPPLTSSLTRVDWQLVHMVCTQGTRTHAELARELGVSVRTVKRRMPKLVDSWAIVSFPRFNFRAIPGGAAASLMYRCSGSARVAEVDARVLTLAQDYLLYFGRWGEVAQLMLIVPNPSAATALATAAGLIEGVGSARVVLVDELVDQPEDIGDYLASRLRRYVSVVPDLSAGPVMRRTMPVGPEGIQRPGVVRSMRWRRPVFPR
jgi:DNA-binding Lrp family transcriptional regulator